MTAPLVYSIAEAATALGASPASVRRMIARGDLRSVRIMGRVVVPIVAVEDLLGIERPAPSPDSLVKAFAQIVGAEVAAS